MASSTYKVGSEISYRLSKTRGGMAGRNSALSFLFSILLTCTVALISMTLAPEFLHWFLLPIVACGILIGKDMIDWLRGAVDLFDARGTLGLLGFHFFFLAPLLIVFWNYRMRYLPEQPDDYRFSLGMMAIYNCAGIVIYRLVLDRGDDKNALQRVRTGWLLRVQRFWVLWAFSVALSLAAELYMLILFGGVYGYMDAYSSWLAGGGDSFEGAALLFAVSESLPILLMIGFAVWVRGRQLGLPSLVGVFAAFVILDFCIGGLRGSRSNVIWTTFWAAGIIHLYVRRIPRTAAIAAIAVLYVFVSLYAAYKQHGAHLLDEYDKSGDYSSFHQDAEDLPTVLVGDFSRADVQASLSWKMEQQAPVQPAWGASYLGALTMLVPKSVWPGRPPTLVRWSTDAEYGKGAYESGAMRSSRVYGITGEAMLNFGLAGIPFAFFLLALVVRTVGKFGRSLRPADVRLLLLPFLVNLIFLLLLDDSDNVVFYLVKYGLVPGLLLSTSSIRLQWRLLPCKSLPQRTVTATL